METLTDRQLGRATLARQMLLERAAGVPVPDAVSRLAGLQAQEPKPPYVGLWTRLEGFEAAGLREALSSGAVVRATAMRATLHLLRADDYLALRTTLQPGLTAAMQGALRGRDEGLDPGKVLPAARKLLASEPRTFNELRALLQERFPDVNHRALGYAVRTNLPLVMVPTDDRWGFARDSKFTLAEDWLGSPVAADADLEGLVRLYLGAFGPAAAADVQAWAGLKGIKAVLDGMGDELAAFKDERGRKLFDLPDSPRPDGDADAPPRFLPEFDNLVLAHKDRSRLLDEEHRGRIVTKNLRVLATYLVDGRVHGTWSASVAKGKATLALAPFAKLPRVAKKPLLEEGERLLRFAEPDAKAYDVRVEA